MSEDYTHVFFDKFSGAINEHNLDNLEEIVDVLRVTRDNNGRVFVLGDHGSIGMNTLDICVKLMYLTGVFASTPLDNTAEIDGYIENDGFKNYLLCWLEARNVNSNDCIFIVYLDEDECVPITQVCGHMQNVGCKIIGIVDDLAGWKWDTQLIKPRVMLSTTSPGMASMILNIFMYFITSHPKLNIEFPVR